VETEAALETQFEATQRRERQARESFRTALIVRSALLVSSVLILGVVVYLLSHTLDPHEPIPEVVIAFGVVSVLEFIAALVLPRLAVPLHPKQPGPANSAEPAASMHSATTSASGATADSGVAGKLLSRSIIAGGCATVPALLGFVLFVMAGDFAIYLAFVSLTLVSSALTFPIWSRWETAIAEASHPAF